MSFHSATLIAVAAVCLGAAASAPSTASVGSLLENALRPAKPRTQVLLIDASASISPGDRSLYRQSVMAFASAIAAGDRVLVATVGDATRSDFRPALDLVVPRHAARLDQEDAIARSSERVRRISYAAIAIDQHPQRTHLLETIAAAAQAFGRQRAPGDRLLILTDAVEESAIINLARQPADVQRINAALAAARSDGLLPNLAGVELVVIGAGGQHYSSVAQFWRRYAVATGATLGQYGRLALSSEN